MIIQCAWCKAFMNEVEPLEDKHVSHGICPKCMEEQFGAVAQLVVQRVPEEHEVVGSSPTRTTPVDRPGKEG